MKVERSKKFEPVTITIESQAELDWLLSCLNNSAKQAKENWARMQQSSLSVDRELDCSEQYQMYKALTYLYK